MKYRCSLIGLALACWAAPGIRADVTIRYESELKPSPAVQALAGGQIAKTACASCQPVTIRMRGNHAYTTVRNWVQLFDFAKQEVTLIDPVHKTYATLPISQLPGRMADALPQPEAKQQTAASQLMAAFKISTNSKMTGATDVIQGVQAEEREITMTMDLPSPAGAAQTVPGLKMVLDIWTAKREETLRNPAIRELTGFYAWQNYVLNPTAMVERFAAKMPGLASAMRPMLDEIAKNQSVVLRMHMEIHMPFLATLGQSQPAVDPSAPFLEMNEEVKELSTTPLDDALFEVPKDFNAAPVDDMVRAMFQAQSPGAPAPAALDATTH